jgi:GNAT superfamily N-acetyltransferase
MFAIEKAREINHAIEVFVRGFCVGKSVTHRYEHFRVGKIWVMRDAPRKNTRGYRKEEWVAYGVPPPEVDAAARGRTRGRFFVCAIRAMNESDDELRAAYKSLGYRLLSTEPLFVHRLKRIPRVAITGRATGGRANIGTIGIERVKTTDMAFRFGKATRSRPITPANLEDDAPFRQFVAVEDDQLVGWVRSVNAGDSTWCSNMYVLPSHRRRGIGRALLVHMLKDDCRRGFEQSVLLSSHTGAMLYPRVGYEQIGLLFIFAPRKTAAS